MNTQIKSYYAQSSRGTSKRTMARTPAAIRCSAVASALVLLLFSLLIQPSTSIYCDEDDCYDLLGVSQSANASEIKKSYYRLSLKYHPDKNPDPESRKLFVKVANAYEILKDEATREQYDYAIAHPEEAIDMVKKTPAYKNRLRGLELERSGGMTNKKKGQKQMDKKMEEDLSKELDLQIKGAEKTIHVGTSCCPLHTPTLHYRKG
ncbi:chaperone DnaJ-domain superfamily protein [Actinidia rufa]|uniref:Chaperone DnaJ-domain superfamily protein n=1 Tax=Actinidia rufa TaxID=165716 RepID=A0A7J0D9J7_9ERIC|nr:chaperone DnaJ-domain superfamily protein [Actinidia rufa]